MKQTKQQKYERQEVERQARKHFEYECFTYKFDTIENARKTLSREKLKTIESQA